MRRRAIQLKMLPASERTSERLKVPALACGSGTTTTTHIESERERATSCCCFCLRFARCSSVAFCVRECEQHHARRRAPTLARNNFVALRSERKLEQVMLCALAKRPTLAASKFAQQQEDEEEEEEEEEEANREQLSESNSMAETERHQLGLSPGANLADCCCSSAAASDYASASPTCALSANSADFYHKLARAVPKAPQARRCLSSSPSSASPSPSPSSSSSLSNSSASSSSSPSSPRADSTFGLGRKQTRRHGNFHRRRLRASIKRLLRSDDDDDDEGEQEQEEEQAKRQSRLDFEAKQMRLSSTSETNEKFAKLDFNSSSASASSGQQSARQSKRVARSLHSAKRRAAGARAARPELLAQDERKLGGRSALAACELWTPDGRQSCWPQLDQLELQLGGSVFGQSERIELRQRQASYEQFGQRAARTSEEEEEKKKRKKETEEREEEEATTCSVAGPQSQDPVYLDDERVFENLLWKERAEFARLSQLQLGPGAGQQLVGQQRHALLSWMLRVCEHQACQDEIFPLACMIADKFLLLRPTPLLTSCGCGGGDDADEPSAHSAPLLVGFEQLEPRLHCDEQWAQLGRRQLCLFAAAALLLATKLRQTPRLSLETLVEFSKLELPIELSREEILDAELLVLATLKWDLAALVVPNDFLAILVRRSARVAGHFLGQRQGGNKQQQQQRAPISSDSPPGLEAGAELGLRPSRCDESRLRRHTQTLLELCLMGE